VEWIKSHTRRSLDVRRSYSDPTSWQFPTGSFGRRTSD